MSTFGKSEEEIQVMQKEATILKELNHPNIITFHDSFLDDKHRFCILTEYASGGDLTRYLKEYQKSRLQENQILDWFTQIALAVHHVHSKNIIHRDIKSDNIFLLQDQKTLKLGDFGIAKIFENKNDKAKTFAGTPYYLSPEILQNRPYSYKSDIWSLGILLYQMCALKLPFEADSIHVLALKIVRGRYQPLSATYFSAALRQLVVSMLQQDPAKRPSIEQIIKSPLILPRVKAMTNEFQEEINARRQGQVKQVSINVYRQTSKADSALLENIKKREDQQKKQKAEEERKKAAIRQKKEQEKMQKEKEREDERQKMRDDIQKKIQEQKQKKGSNEVIIEQFGSAKEEKKEEKKQEVGKKKQKQKEIVVEIFLPNCKKSEESPPESEKKDEEGEWKECNKENQDMNQAEEDDAVANELSGQKANPIREMNVAEEESLQFISDYGKVEELRLLLEGYFGTETFMKAYHILKKEVSFPIAISKAEQKDIDLLAKQHGHNFYQDILPFIPKDSIINYIPFLLTLIYMEQAL